MSSSGQRTHLKLLTVGDFDPQTDRAIEYDFIGRVIAGRDTIQAHIGGGGMADVYRATAEETRPSLSTFTVTASRSRLPVALSAQRHQAAQAAHGLGRAARPHVHVAGAADMPLSRCLDKALKHTPLTAPREPASPRPSSTSSSCERRLLAARDVHAPLLRPVPRPRSSAAEPVSRSTCARIESAS